MIQFRCWYCNRRYSKPPQSVGERIECACRHALRVPRRSGGYCRVKTVWDWLVETVVYGGGCGFLGGGLGLLVASRMGRVVELEGIVILVGGLAVAGLVAGTLGGERAVNCFGRWIRSTEDADPPY